MDFDGQTSAGDTSLHGKASEGTGVAEPTSATPEGPSSSGESEQPTQEQLIDKLFAAAEDRNRELENEMAHHYTGQDGSETLVFKMRTVKDPNRAMSPLASFGVNTKLGPVVLREHIEGQMTQPSAYEVHDVSSQVNIEADSDLIALLGEERGMEAWQKAAEASVAAVLRNQEWRERKKQERMNALQGGIDVFTKPLDLDNPPPPAEPVVVI